MDADTTDSAIEDSESRAANETEPPDASPLDTFAPDTSGPDTSTPDSGGTYDCVAGAFRCSGDHLERCNSSGTTFESIKLCSPGLCDPIARECDECKLGTGKCSDTGASPSTCDATGHWKGLAPCAEPTPFCSAGACVAATPGWHPLPTPASLPGRSEHTAVWSNAISEMLVWGGTGCSGFTAFCADGARWNKKTNAWTMLPTSIVSGRRSHTAVWTGTQMVMWGGYGGGPPSSQLGDGAAYEPLTNAWTKLAPGGPTARDQHSAVWTGSEMIVWGGEGPTFGTARADGMRWTPGASGGSWSPMKASPLSPRKNTHAVWTGSKMIVFGGYGTACTAKTSPTDGWGFCGDGAAYDPTTDTWTMLAAAPIDARSFTNSAATGPSGGLATFLHGTGLSSATVLGRDDGATYDPIANTWTKIASPGDAILPPAKRYSGFVWWSAGKLYSWGGINITGATFTYPTNGASYDPVTSTWASMPAGGPSGRHSGTVVWTGSEAVLFGGRQGALAHNTGRIFRP